MISCRPAPYFPAFYGLHNGGKSYIISWIRIDTERMYHMEEELRPLESKNFI